MRRANPEIGAGAGGIGPGRGFWRGDGVFRGFTGEEGEF